MKISAIRDMTPDQLGDKLLELKKEQFNLRFQQGSGQLSNTARVRQVRHDYARLLTVRGERDKETEKKEAADGGQKDGKG